MINYRDLLKQVPDHNKLSITLQERPNKGVSIVATKTIQKGDLIAYYKCKVFKESDYQSPTNFVYSFEVYRKNGESYKRFIGDIDGDSFPPPGSDNISYWAPFANEPSVGQRVNSEIVLDLKNNYKERNYLTPGETVIYKLKATKQIKKGSEVLWYYGEQYQRNYKVGKH